MLPQKYCYPRENWRSLPASPELDWKNCLRESLGSPTIATSAARWLHTEFFEMDLFPNERGKNSETGSTATGWLSRNARPRSEKLVMEGPATTSSRDIVLANLS